MSTPFAKKTFISFDGSESYEGKLFCPDRYRLLENTLREADSVSVQGAGLSFAPLSFGGGSVTLQLNHFDRVLSFDHTQGVIEVESGMTLGSLAQLTIPKGWCLKVQPGHPSITLGGCLGTDVHGKNQFQDLNFKEQVVFLKVYHPDKGLIFCDRNTQAELFHLTCGGWGLSGIVISLGIQLGKLTSHQIENKTIPLGDIFQLPALLQERSLKDDLLYSWHDFNTQSNWGRGFLKAGRYLKSSTNEISNFTNELKGLKSAAVLSSEKRGLTSLNMLTPLSIRAMNYAYSAKELSHTQPTIQPLVEFLFPVINKTIYYDLFGTRGFHETQVLIPFDRFDTVINEIKGGLKRFSIPVSLASCKLFKGQQELLRFIGHGIVLALNFPRSADSLNFLNWWDSIVIQNKCLPNIAKDSRLDLKTIESCYPQFQDFKSKLQKWDSRRVFQSSLSKRLQL